MHLATRISRLSPFISPPGLLAALVMFSLSTLPVVLLPAVSVAQSCPPPAGFTNTTTVQEGDLKVTLATDRYDYLVNQAVNIYLALENAGSTSLTIPNVSLITPLESFLILPADCTDYETPAGCSQATLFAYPGIVSFFGQAVTLPPGACRTYTQQWHGTPRLGGTTAPGFYSVIGGLHTALGQFHAPTGGARLMIRINPDIGVPAMPASWSGVKALAGE